MTFYLILTVLPKDDVIHELKIETEGMKKLKKNFSILGLLSIIIFNVTLLSNQVPMPYIISLTVTPLGYYGYLVGKEEGKIRHKEANFGPFMRTLGGAAGARSGQITEVLGVLRYHEYGPLTRHIDSLYRRLELGDSDKAWRFFAGEIGSDLILKFSVIFREGIMIGANPGKIAEIISTNFERVTNLRGERHLTASSMKGTLYGSGIGMALAIYVTIGIITFLIDNVSNLTGIEQILSGASKIGGLNMGYLNLLIWVALVLHSGIAAITLKFTDGGDIQNAFFHFSIMLWISAVIAVSMPPIFSKLFGVKMAMAV
jgi:flagellar protein FlaJ